MKFFAGRSEALQQLCQRTFNVLLVVSQASLSSGDAAKREQNQQRLMWRALSVCPPESYLAKLLKKIVAFHH